jgi:hypothetical protein
LKLRRRNYNESEHLEKTKASILGRNTAGGRFDRRTSDRICNHRARGQCLLFSRQPGGHPQLVCGHWQHFSRGDGSAPNCSPSNCPTPITEATSSAYPYVFNNDTLDCNFGITLKIFLDQISPTGMLVTSPVAEASSHGWQFDEAQLKVLSV